MKTNHDTWTISKLVKNAHRIEFPEFQREPNVWDLEKKQRLIDSILRDFDISTIYFHEREDGNYDCIDGRQRINAIWSYLGINRDYDSDYNGFNLRIVNEIYDDAGRFDGIKDKRYENLSTDWQRKIENYRLNIVFVSELDEDKGELNLLFLRLQIASVLNAGEKLHAMTGEMRDFIFNTLKANSYLQGIKIPSRRFAKEQVAAQIALNVFSRKMNGTFQRSRFTDLQEFFKQYSKFSNDEKDVAARIESNLNTIAGYFREKLAWIRNRAMAVSIYLFMSDLIEVKRLDEIDQFIDFQEKFLKTLKWQIPKGVQIHPAYYDILNFQTNITQAAGEKQAIVKRHSALNEYFEYYEHNGGKIKGDEEYRAETGRDPNQERSEISL